MMVIGKRAGAYEKVAGPGIIVLVLILRRGSRSAHQDALSLAKLLDTTMPPLRIAFLHPDLGIGA